MALLRWDDEDRERDELLTPVRQTVRSVQDAWQPANNASIAEQSNSGIFGEQPSQPQDNTYLMSNEKAQVDFNLAQKRAQEAEDRRQAAIAAQAQAQAAQAAAQQYTPVSASGKQLQKAKDNNGWKKYYDKEFKRERQGQNFLERVLDGGGASRRAEVSARSRYTSDLVNKAYDEVGNVRNLDAARAASLQSQYNSNTATQNAMNSRALSNSIGATAQNADQNIFDRLKSTANVIRSASLYDGLAGVNDTTRFGLDDIGRFGGGLVQGIATAPILAGKSLTEAATGRGTKTDTGLEGELTGAERAGRTVSGLIDAITPFMAGSGQFTQSLMTKVFANTATAAEKRLVSRMLTAAAEEGVLSGTQAGSEWFGRGGILQDENGNIDVDKLSELAMEVGTGAGMGAIGGAGLSAAGTGINRIRRPGEVDTPNTPEMTPTQPTPTQPTPPRVTQPTPLPTAPRFDGQAPIAEGTLTPVRPDTPIDTIQPVERVPSREMDLDPTARPEIEAPPVEPEIQSPVTPVRPVTPDNTPEQPRPSGEQVRELRESRAGTTQAEEAAINQRLQQIERSKPRVLSDEYVEGKTLYRGGKPFDKKLVGSDGTSFSTDKAIADRWRGSYKNGVTEEFQLAPDAKVMVAPKPDVPLGRLTDSDKFALVAEASRNGYDAVDMTSWGEKEIRIVNPDKLNIANKDVRSKSTSEVTPDSTPSKTYSGGLDATHQRRLKTLRHNADAYSDFVTRLDKAVVDAQKGGYQIDKGTKARRTRNSNLAESHYKAAEIIENSAPNKVYATDKKGNPTEHPASHILEAFSKSMGEDMPPIVVASSQGTSLKMGSVSRNANADYNHPEGIIRYKSKNSVYHETVHNIDMSVRDYRGDNPKMLKLQELRKGITPAEIAKFRKLENRVKNDKEYVAYAMEQLYDGRIKAGTLGEGVLRYVKEFFTTIKDAFSSSTLYNRPKYTEAVEYVKQLDKAIHGIDAELAKKAPAKVAPKSVTPIKSKSTTKPTPKSTPKPTPAPKPATPKPKSGFVEPPPVQPTKPKSAPTPVKPKGVKPASAPKAEPKPVKTPTVTKPKAKATPTPAPQPKSDLPEGMTPVDTPKKGRKPVDNSRKDAISRFATSSDGSKTARGRLAEAVGMKEDGDSDLASILEGGNVKGRAAERITKIHDEMEEIAKIAAKTKKQNRADFTAGREIDQAANRITSSNQRRLGLLQRRLDSELKALKRRGFNVPERATQLLQNTASGRLSTMLTGAGLIERNVAQEIGANLISTLKNPIKTTRGAFNHGSNVKSAIKSSADGWKVAPKTVSEGYAYLTNNVYTTAMTPADAAARMREGGMRTEMTQWWHKELLDKDVPAGEAEKLSRAMGNLGESVVSMLKGVDNGMTSNTQAMRALNAWKQFMKTGSKADMRKLEQAIDTQSTLANAMIRGFNFKENSKRGRFLSTMVNSVFPFMRTAYNLTNTGVTRTLNPFSKSLLDDIRADQRSGGKNAALILKNKLIDYGMIGGAVALVQSDIINYNDGEDVDKPRGISIKIGDNEYVSIRATPIEMPLAVAATVGQIVKDVQNDDIREPGYYGKMLSGSLPYIDQLEQNTALIDSVLNIGGKDGDGGYALKQYGVNLAKSHVPGSNNGIQAYLERWKGNSLNAKKVYDEDPMTWLYNSVMSSFDPKFRDSLEDSRDNAGRVRTVDNQGTFIRKNINDKNTRTHNESITNLVTYARQSGLGNGTQEMFNTYDNGKNNNFRTIHGAIFAATGGKEGGNEAKLEQNDKLYDLSQQIRDGFFGDGEDLLKIGEDNLYSDVSMPSSTGAKNTSKPINMKSIKNAIAQTDLPEAERDRMYEISQEVNGMYDLVKSKEITYDQYQAARAELESEYDSILGNSESYQKMNSLMEKLDEEGFFEEGGLGSTRSGQTYLWNSLNALLGDKGKTPAAEYPKDEKSGWGGGGRKRSNRFGEIYKPAKSKGQGIKWEPVGKRQMADVKKAKYTPAKIRVKLNNAVKRDRTQNYSDRSF